VDLLLLLLYTTNPQKIEVMEPALKPTPGLPAGHQNPTTIVERYMQRRRFYCVTFCLLETVAVMTVDAISFELVLLISICSSV